MKKLFCICLISYLIVFAFPITVHSLEKEAYFAGGCFWCLEHDMEEITGVLSAKSGYAGGELKNPTYENHSGHTESVSVIYDSSIVTYDELLRGFWRNIDPLDNQGQFCDRGNSYRPIIFTQDDRQNKSAELSLKYASIELEKKVKDLKVEIQPLKEFWDAEDYHQDFAKKNSFKYNFYRFSCGRDLRLDDVWGDKARQVTSWESN